MAKRKTKVIMASLSLFLSLSFLVLGVYSAVSERRATLTGTIIFTPAEVRMSYKLESSGAYGGSAEPSYNEVASGIADFGNAPIDLSIPLVDLNSANNKFSYRVTFISLDKMKAAYGSFDYKNITDAAFNRTVTAKVNGIPFTGVWFDLPAEQEVEITYVFEIDSAYVSGVEPIDFNIGSNYSFSLQQYTFADATPTQILYTSETNTFPANWKVGDTKPIAVDGVGPVNIRISDLKTKDETGAEVEGRYEYNNITGRKTRIVLEFVEVMEKGTKWHSSNDNTYATSSLRAYLNNGFFEKLPDEWKAVIPEVKVPTATAGSQADGDVIQYLPEKVFNLSEIEAGKRSNSHPGEGSEFDYYTENSNSSRRKKDIDNTAANWWLRSPYASSTYYASSIVIGGGFNFSSVSSPYSGVSPCFAI